MNSYDENPQQPERNRRAERYAGEFLNEPSMSAPQPIPEKSGRSARKETAPVNAAPPQPPQEWPQPYPVQPVDEQGYPAPQGWQPYPVQPDGQGYPALQDWSQPYPAQPVDEQGYPAPQGWQPYPVQPDGQGYPVPQEWQPYPAQPVNGQGYPVPQGWQQPAQPARLDWSQPYVPQQTYAAPPQDWQPSNGYAPPPNPPAGGKDGSGSGDGPGGIGWWKIALAVAAVVLVAVLAIGGTRLNQNNALLEKVSAYNDRFCQGVYVDGIHLGGMTQQEAVNAVTANAQQRMASWNVRLTYQGNLIRKITAGDLGMTVDVHDALAAAWEQGHASSSVAERSAAMDALLEKPYAGYTALPSGDTSVVDAILNELAAVVYREPQDAYVKTFDPLMTSYPFIIEPEVPGVFLDVEPVKAEIYDMVRLMESTSIELAPQVLQPAVTEADVRKQYALRGSATTEISTTSTENRNANIQRAFELINGKILRPGESFSFNTVVGERSRKNGFFLAIEYAYSQEREGYGGGVCQASSTIYLAAVRANMTVTKREPHSDKVNYTDYGLDATVNYDGKKIDLVFRNTTDSDVYILSYLERSGAGGRWVCKVDIYGASLEEGVTYDLVAETVEVLQPPPDPEYVEDNTGTHVVYIDETPVQKRKASEGYVVDSFIVKYLNGEEVERKYVATDTYKAKAQQFWVGVSER